MSSHSHRKFRWGTVFATGRRSFIEPETILRMKRTNRRTRVPIGLYPCHIEEKMTIKEVKGESVMEWKTKMKTKEGVIVTQVTANVNNINGGNGNDGNDGCSYKTFTACNPKEFDGKCGALTLTHWIEKMESVFENSGCTANQRVSWNDFKALLVEGFCPSNEMEKLENEFWNHIMVGSNHVTYTDGFHELAKLVPHLVTPESSRIKRHEVPRYIGGLLFGRVSTKDLGLVMSSASSAVTYTSVYTDSEPGRVFWELKRRY
ncbi:hypothetical protein Tco_0281311 [Tanacetum coccineum]